MELTYPDTVRTYCSPLYEITTGNNEVSRLCEHDLVVVRVKGFCESFDHLHLILSIIHAISSSHVHDLETALLSLSLPHRSLLLSKVSSSSYDDKMPPIFGQERHVKKVFLVYRRIVPVGRQGHVRRKNSNVLFANFNEDLLYVQSSSSPLITA